MPPGATRNATYRQNEVLREIKSSGPLPGRPLLVYALTRRGQAWFEESDNSDAISILLHAEKLFGPASSGKLLFLYFQERLEKYRAAIPASLPIAEKMERLTALRDSEGCMALLDIGIRIIERHSPWAALHKSFPEADALEESFFRQILGVPVRRKFQILGDQYEIRHELHTPIAQRPS